MSFAHILNAYLNINLLVITGFLSMGLYTLLARLKSKLIGGRLFLKLHYAVIVILFCLTFSFPLLPERGTSFPSVRIWSAQPETPYTADNIQDTNAGTLHLPGIIKTKSFDTDNAVLVIVGFIIFLFTVGVIKISIDIRTLFLIKRGSYLIRKCRSVSIYANDSIKIPFSYWLPGSANIFIPTDLIGKPKDYKITIYHELQHHRNGDTKWVYLLWFLKTICFLNPCIHLWSRLISELQEFACDEVLVDRKKIDSQEYARCLIEAAKSASDRRRAPVCATGLTLMVQRQLLKRRIQRMFIKIPNQLKWQVNFVVLILIMGLMITISCASKGVVQDSRITMEQAVDMAEKAKADTDYPIVVNDLVLKELNRYLGTPEGREYVGTSLDRMKDYRKDIEEKIKEYGVPMEFLAIPLVESGYQKLQKGKPGFGAGLWDFISSTARKFGLKVNNKMDERLDVDISTDAAMRYLSENRVKFNDWQLSVLAYNVGEGNVQRVIEETGSRDVWELSRVFYKDSNNHYAKFMAAVIIMKNPDSVAEKMESLAKQDETVFIWPLKGWVSSKYGYRISPLDGEKEFHTGTDISARTGTPIVAAASGTVKEVKSSPKKGRYLILQHSNNFQTFYSHCQKIMVKEGQAVKKGVTIATCGNTGKSTGPHLHFELRHDGMPIDPEKFIESW